MSKILMLHTWVEQLESISNQVLDMMFQIKFVSEIDDDGKERSTLSPNAQQQIEINNLASRFYSWSDEINRFLIRFPLQKSKFDDFKDLFESYLRYNRVGGAGYNNDTWKKQFVMEFFRVSQSIGIFFKELAEVIQNGIIFKCFLTSEDCNIEINQKEKSVFVIMPFSQELNDIYKLGIKETLVGLGYDCYRADEILHKRNIMCRGICKPMQEASLIIADMTNKNTNVFFELGLAYGFEKEVLLLSRSLDDIPFDLRGIQSIVYDSISVLREEIKRFFESK